MSEDVTSPPTKPDVQILSFIPMRDIVIFPEMIVPLIVGRDTSIQAVDQAMDQGSSTLFLTTQKEASVENPDQQDLHPIGVIARILQKLRLPDGSIKILVEGTTRARLESLLTEDGVTQARVTTHLKATSTSEESDENLEAFPPEMILRSIKKLFKTYSKNTSNITSDTLKSLEDIHDIGHYADMIAIQLPISIQQKQEVLSELNSLSRGQLIMNLLQREIEWSEVENRIHQKVKNEISEEQQRYVTQKKINIIQEELREEDPEHNQSEIDILIEKVKTLKLPPDAHERIMNDVNKLKQMPPMSAEATVIHNYLDWVLALPWHKEKKLNHDISKAKAKLDHDHYALEKIKERVLENIAVQIRVKALKGPIICLVGPPGVGKTSLGKSIAGATGRAFTRISLGGVRDEAEIRGHRKTYIGAMPGRIIKGMKKAGTLNPCILLDEIDKMGTDFRGDPASALLEVLDPEQNNTFVDHYLEVEYDLSKVLFITTANSLDIPPALLDRMEIIRIPGYTENEKMHIAKQYLIPKCAQETGIRPNEVKIPDSIVNTIIQHYTREAGVRALERNISKIFRKIVYKQQHMKKPFAKKLSHQHLEKLLGPQKYDFEAIGQKDTIGLVRGMAWTQVGGDLLTLEAVALPGKGKHCYTGSLGDIMKESVQAAVTVARQHALKHNIEKAFFQDNDIHIHVPTGATPKDGPSAGIGLCTAIYSTVTQQPVRHDIAMTGEITLRGDVLAIGGIKEKLLAAHRGRIHTIILPKENEKDLIDIPQEISSQLTIHTVTQISEVFQLAFAKNTSK